MGAIGSFFKEKIIDPVMDNVVNPIIDTVVNPVIENVVEPIVGATPLGNALGIGQENAGQIEGGDLSEADIEFLTQFIEYQIASRAISQMFSIMGGSDDN